MALQHTNEADLSDDEIYVGPLTFKEMKKRLLRPLLLPRWLTSAVTSPEISNKKVDLNESVKIIETHSAPDIVSCHTRHDLFTVPILNQGLSPDGYASMSELNASDYSFLMHEKITAESGSPVNKAREDIDFKSTQIVVSPCASDYSFLMHEKITAESGSPVNKAREDIDLKSTQIVVSPCGSSSFTPSKLNFATSTAIKPHPPMNKERENIDLKSTQLVVTPCGSSFFTPTKLNFATSTEIKPDLPTFKTPGNPVSSRKLLCPQPRKRFDHIKSPVRAYIHDNSQTPLLKDMCPRKAVSGTSLIPKPIKNCSHTNITEKDTTQLPSVAYQTAKETKLMDVKAANKIPPSAKKVTSSIPKTVILKHTHRETNHSQKPLPKNVRNTLDKSELLQADLSYCTQTFAKKL